MAAEVTVTDQAGDILKLELVLTRREARAPAGLYLLRGAAPATLLNTLGSDRRSRAWPSVDLGAAAAPASDDRR